MGMKRALHIFLCIVIGSCMFATWGMKKSRVAAIPESQVTMSEYFYMESEKQAVLENHEAAFALVQEALRLNPDLLQAKYSLAKSFLKLNRPDSALALLREISESDSTHFWYNYGYANTAAHMKKYDEARVAFERIVRNHKDKPDIYGPLASVYIEQKEYEKALACYDSIETYMGNSPELATGRVEVYDMMGDTATAISIAEDLVAKKPTDVYHLLYLSNVYNHYKRHEQRLEVLNRASQLQPDEPLIAIEKAHYHLSQGDTAAYHNEYEKILHNKNVEFEIKKSVFDEYIRGMAQWPDKSPITEAYKTFIDLYPFESALRREFIQILFYLDRYDVAIEQLNTLAEQTDEADVWDSLAYAYMQAGQYDNVKTAGGKAIEKGSKNIVTHIYLSNIYSTEHLYDKAVEYIHNALSLCDENRKNERSYLYGSLGDIYFQQKMLEECFQYYDTALIYNPNNATVLNNYAYNLVCNGGDLLKAEKMSSAALNAEPENNTFIDTYAWVLFKMRSYTLARIYIEKAIKLIEPDDEGANVYYEHYGDILAMSGETDAAVEQWQKSYDMAPTEILKKKIEQREYIEE